MGGVTLVEFLTARLDEDEAAVDVAGTFGPPDPSWGDAPLQRWDHGEMLIGPARVLREVEAKRAIVEDYELLARDYRETRDPTTEARRFQALVEIARLAAIWRDHPDYDEAWRP